MPWRLFSLAGLMLAVGILAADDKKPDMEKMMAAIMQHATPGEAHKIFDHFAGDWTYTGKWYSPDGTVVDMGGKSECKTMMDGRFFSEHLVGNGQPMPFEGKAVWGYDNAKKKYWFSWIDSMTTSLSTGEGSWDVKNKTLTWISEMYDAGQGKNCKFREVAVVKPDGGIHKTFYKTDAGKETKEMEFTYSKAK